MSKGTADKVAGTVLVGGAIALEALGVHSAHQAITHAVDTHASKVNYSAGGIAEADGALAAGAAGFTELGRGFGKNKGFREGIKAERAAAATKPNTIAG